MGYTTDFSGQIKIDPPFNAEEIEFLTKFSHTRRMNRKKGPYYVDGTGDFGQGADEDIIDHNRPPEGQPSLWCQWVPTEDGTHLEWDGNEKFYCSAEWMMYLMENFIAGPAPKAVYELPFLVGHTCNGEIEAYGEDPDDRWLLIVDSNKVTTKRGRIVYE